MSSPPLLTLQQQLSSMLVAAAGCKAVYPTLDERKKHFMQSNAPPNGGDANSGKITNGKLCSRLL